MVFLLLYFTQVDPWLTLNEMEINSDSIPTIFKEVEESKLEGAFAAFIIPANNNLEEAINIQFSYENGRAGLDWVLLGKENIRDRKAFENYLKNIDVHYVKKINNDVHYLRVTSSDLVALCQNILRDMYNIKPLQPFGVVYKGIDLEKYVQD